ncbi:MAG TPA: hypothetical protein VF732_06750 [Nitrospira sp.]
MGSSTVRWIIAVITLVAADFAQGEIARVGSPNANPGTVTDLGNGVGIQSDPHGRSETNLAPTESAAPLSPVPHGDMNQRLVTPFGSPQPPNQLTPAPVLPFHPNRPLMPQSAPPSGGGRFGR